MKFEKQKLNAKIAAGLIHSANEEYRDRQEWEEAPTKIRHLEMASWVPSGISLATASFAVIYVSQPYPIATKIGIIFLLGALVIVNEILKRRTAKVCIKRHFRKQTHSPIIMLGLVITMLMSMCISFYGGNNGITANVPRPTLPANTEIDSLQNVVASLDQEIAKYQATTWKGKIVNDVRPMLNLASNRREAIISKIDQLDNDDREIFKATLGEFEQQLLSFGLIFGLIAAFCDFFLIGIFAEIGKIKRNLHQLYGDDPTAIRFYSNPGPRIPPFDDNFIKKKHSKSRQRDNTPGEAGPPDDMQSHDDTGSNSVATDMDIDTDIEAYQEAYKNAKSNWSAWNSKIEKGIGTLETNKRNRDKWQKKMDYYAAKLNALGASI